MAKIPEKPVAAKGSEDAPKEAASRNISRRFFLGTMTAAGASALIGPSTVKAAGEFSGC